MTDIRNNTVLNRCLLFLVTLILSCGTRDSQATSHQQRLIESARGVIASLGRDPASFDARIVTRDPGALYRNTPGKESPPESVLFTSRSPGEYPLWVSSVAWKRVEWWVDDRGFRDRQSQAIANATAHAFPGVAEPLNLYRMRVFETPGCLIFLFMPRIEQPTPDHPGDFHVVLASDTYVALNSRQLTPDHECESRIQTINQWDP